MEECCAVGIARVAILGKELIKDGGIGMSFYDFKYLIRRIFMQYTISSNSNTVLDATVLQSTYTRLTGE